MPGFKDKTGQRFGKLVVTERVSNKRSRVRWECQCDCGNVTQVDSSNLNSHTQSCGCSHVLPKGEAAFNRVYHMYQQGASSRDLSFDLTKEDFKKVIERNCYYCGEAPNKIYGDNNNGTYQCGGIDRVDNSKGYSVDNCVPCCRWCNLAKGTLTEEQFIDKIVSIYTIHGYYTPGGSYAPCKK